MSKGLCRWKVGLRGTHQTKQRKKENRKKKRVRRAGSLEKTFTPFPEKKSVRWRGRVKEKERWGRVMVVGVSGSVCPLPPL